MYKKQCDLVKICFLVSRADYKSGIFRVVKNIAAELIKDEKYKISILSCFYLKNDIVENYNNITVDSLEINYNIGKLKYLKMIPLLARYIEEKTPDYLLVSGMEFCLPVFLSRIKNKYKTKIIAWEHINFLNGPKLRLEYIGKRIACKKFDGIINITKKDYEMYRKYSKSVHLTQIYNLTDFEEMKIKYNTKSCKILSVGYLGYLKGFDMLIDIAAEVLRDYPQWTWDIYGEGKERENLERKIKTLGLEDKVFFKGYRKDMYRLYSQYSFFVLTSRAEGMGMVLVEAQKSGLPIVSFDIPCGPSDIIQDGINGYLISPFELGSMAKKIKLLIENKDIRIKFSENSMIKHKEFQKDIIVDKWKKLLV